MAAIVRIQPTDTPQRPRLTVIEGGRAPGSSARAGAAPVAAVRTRRRSSHVYLVRRLVVAGLLAVLVLGGVAGGRAVLGGEASPATAGVYHVAAGDTLWGIAGEIDPGGDRGALVSALAAANGGTVVRPGQTLVIPAEVMERVG